MLKSFAEFIIPILSDCARNEYSTDLTSTKHRQFM